MKMSTALIIGIVGLAALATAGTAAAVVIPGRRRRLSPSEIAAYAAQAGFSGDDLITAVAIALAESGGDPQAYNPEEGAGTPEGQGSYGLWQIYLAAHPEFAGWDLFDPAVNARAAYAVWRQQGFDAWSTYRGGQYFAYLDQAQQGVSA